MKKVLMSVMILGSVLSYADVTDNVQMSEEEFYDTKIGQTVERMEERHKRIVILDATITEQINEFNTIYNKAKGLTKNSECSRLKHAITRLDMKVELYKEDENNNSQINISGLQQMVINLESKKNTMCKGK